MSTSENERNNWRDEIEQLNLARQARSDAAWRPFEEKWTALVGPAYRALDAIQRNAGLCDTPAEADAVARLNDLLRRMARDAAETAFARDFETRSGFRVLAGVLRRDSLCVVYNNHPYKGCPTRRDKELAEFRAWLADMGVDELAYAEHPDRGPHEGYSYALLLWCVPGSEPHVEGQYLATILKGFGDPPAG
jgi:hypothetical protein